MANKTLMIQGCTSDAGKSFVVTALCRALYKRGLSVAPFKPQNMALNSAVTAEGGEIGRAQAVQALAACVEPHVDMNPILLKPNTDIGAQVVIQGKAIGNMNADEYHAYKKQAMVFVCQSHENLENQYDAVVVEGAGSPAEINLREHDIANMGFAERVDCPVIIVADIDKGGVFAHLVGTLELLSESEQNRVVGFIINRFRGDIKLLEPGIEWLERRTGKPVLGVLSYLMGLHLEAEDAVNIQSQPDDNKEKVKIIVPVYPRISNHTDFDPLRHHPQVDISFVGPNQLPPDGDLVILPGSKSAQNDLQWLRDNGWEKHIQRHLRYGGKLIGICGGYQMLGNKIKDPGNIESDIMESDGFGLLDIETELLPSKTLKNVSGVIESDGSAVTGYEIHSGRTTGACNLTPFATITDSSGKAQYYDGLVSGDNQIIGTYLHGLFEHPAAMKFLLNWSGLDAVEAINIHEMQEESIDRAAVELENSVDIDALIARLTGNDCQVS